MDKSIWPTAAKLERLKGLGLLPISIMFCASAVLLGVLGSLWSLRHEILALLQAVPTDRPSLIAWVGSLAKILILPAVICVVLSIFCTLLQTKFNLRLANIDLDLGRLSSAEFKRQRVAGIFAVILSEIFAVTLIAGLFYKYLGDFLLIMRFGGPQWLALFGAAILPGSLSGLLLMALLSLIVVRLFFRLRHRMDSSELQRELAAGLDDDGGRVDAVS